MCIDLNEGSNESEKSCDKTSLVCSKSKQYLEDNPIVEPLITNPQQEDISNILLYFEIKKLIDNIEFPDPEKDEKNIKLMKE